VELVPATKLFANAGATPTQDERDEAITAYGAGDTAGRAGAFRSVIQSGSVFNKLYNDAFVLMQYYGYLRRNPDDAPDQNFSGYAFWLAKLNQFTLPGEDARNESVALARVRRAEMVEAFIVSAEYRQRFGGALSGNQAATEVTVAVKQNCRTGTPLRGLTGSSPTHGSHRSGSWASEPYRLIGPGTIGTSTNFDRLTMKRSCYVQKNCNVCLWCVVLLDLFWDLPLRDRFHRQPYRSEVD
jgi:hypothetical protein